MSNKQLSNKQLLDQLMGDFRNGDVSQPKNFDDPAVCKNFLLGFCINDYFLNTKMDMGACTKTHSKILVDQYEKECKAKDTDFGYAWDLMQSIERVVSECDALIAKQMRRVDVSKDEDTSAIRARVMGAAGDESEEVKQINTQIRELQASAESLGDEGKVDEAKGVLALVKELEAKKQSIVDGEAAQGPSPQLQNLIQIKDNTQKLIVCDVCGALLSKFDNNRRLADHFGGKLHLGYKALRDKLEELRKLNPQPLRSRRDRDRDLSPRSERDRRDRDRRSRSRSRDRRDRERRDRDRSDRDRSDRDRRDRDRSDRDRRRSRSRSRDRRDRRR